MQFQYYPTRDLFEFLDNQLDKALDLRSELLISFVKRELVLFE